MQNNQPLDGDQIDLFDMIETLWDGRKILATFIIVAIAICGCVMVLHKARYVTTAQFEINPKPPFLSYGDIEADVIRTFYNAKTFAKWKESNSGVSLSVDLIDQKQMIDGAAFGMKEESKIISINEGSVKIKSNDVKMIFEVLDYFEFAGLKLSERYFVEAERERNRFEKLEKQLLSKLNSNDALPTIESIAEIDRYLDKVFAGKQTVLVSRPLPPQKIGISNSLMWILSFLFGGGSGVVFIFLRKAYQGRSTQLADLGT